MFYFQIIRAEGPWSVLFFLMSVFLGPFYLLNLLLAVVTLAYSKEHEKQVGPGCWLYINNQGFPCVAILLNLSKTVRFCP